MVFERAALARSTPGWEVVTSAPWLIVSFHGGIVLLAIALLLLFAVIRIANM